MLTFAKGLQWVAANATVCLDGVAKGPPLKRNS